MHELSLLWIIDVILGETPVFTQENQKEKKKILHEELTCEICIWFILFIFPFGLIPMTWSLAGTIVKITQTQQPKFSVCKFGIRSTT